MLDFSHGNEYAFLILFICSGRTTSADVFAKPHPKDVPLRKNGTKQNAVANVRRRNVLLEKNKTLPHVTVSEYKLFTDTKNVVNL